MARWQGNFAVAFHCWACAGNKERRFESQAELDGSLSVLQAQKEYRPGTAAEAL